MDSWQIRQNHRNFERRLLKIDLYDFVLNRTRAQSINEPQENHFQKTVDLFQVIQISRAKSRIMEANLNAKH